MNMKKILKVIKEIFGWIAYCSSMSLIMIGLYANFNLHELILISTCAFILYAGLSLTLKNLDGD